MTIAFDFHTLSLTIDQTLGEYRRAIAPSEGTLGLHLWEINAGRRSQALRFRHEHAHFTSYMASGLADLYGVFSDYLLGFLYLVLRAESGQGFTRPLQMPLFSDHAGVVQSNRAVVESAWEQVNSLRAMFFGFGTNDSLDELTALREQDAFWALYHDDRFTPIVKRFYEFVSLLPRRIEDAEATRGHPIAALPSVEIAGQRRQLTTRSVMETYAISIELMNTFFRSVITDLTVPESTTRNPGPLYTTALAYALECGRFAERATVDQFLYGDAKQSLYYEIAAISFAAMQIPCIQRRDGLVVIDGTVDTLCPAHRFVGIVDALAEGRIPHLPDDVRSSARDQALLEWLAACHAAIGDEISMNIVGFVAEQFQSDPDLQEMTTESQSLVELSWAARANLCGSATDYVLDGGLFSERYPCQVRFVRTSDAKLAFLGDDTESFQARYIAEHSVPILEAAIFPRQWDSTWARMPEIPTGDRGQATVNSIVYAAGLFGDINPSADPSVPIVVVTTQGSTNRPALVKGLPSTIGESRRSARRHPAARPPP